MEDILSTNPFKVLGLDQWATDADIKSAYRKLIGKWHPDRNSDPNAVEYSQKILDAFERIKKIRAAKISSQQQFNQSTNVVRRTPAAEESKKEQKLLLTPPQIQSTSKAIKPIASEEVPQITKTTNAVAPVPEVMQDIPMLPAPKEAAKKSKGFWSSFAEGLGSPFKNKYDDKPQEGIPDTFARILGIPTADKISKMSEDEKPKDEKDETKASSKGKDIPGATKDTSKLFKLLLDETKAIRRSIRNIEKFLSPNGSTSSFKFAESSPQTSTVKEAAKVAADVSQLDEETDGFDIPDVPSSGGSIWQKTKNLGKKAWGGIKNIGKKAFNFLKGPGGKILGGVGAGLVGAYTMYSGLKENDAEIESKKQELNAALESGEITKDEYESQMNDLNKLSKEKNGSTIGSGIGTVLGGIAGSALGPVGAIAGASLGGWAGEKIGGFIGSKGGVKIEPASEATKKYHSWSGRDMTSGTGDKINKLSSENADINRDMQLQSQTSKTVVSTAVVSNNSQSFIPTTASPRINSPFTRWQDKTTAFS
jgi:hypothetical protein